MNAPFFARDTIGSGRERIRIRAARREDLDGLAALDAWAWPDGARPESGRGAPFATRFSLADLTVALAGERHIGFIALSPRSRDAANSHVGLARALLVATDFRGLGVATSLFAAAEAWARARGFVKIDAHVLSGNRAGAACLGKLGFSVEGRLRGEYRIDGQLIDELHLAKWLSAPDALRAGSAEASRGPAP
ncbi:RimJ/RimL family protein N-acetyltransferase [Rhodoblastus acidophilus]|uniref:GNAT family N-acetyltransferase n=1 Tax=Rhodoblastus acidophilus TaxID=1074 RepID=UPI002223FE5D|nr:GNAT family N-acetyltransferase [Rhodoblastus acidophilus]MCW2285605.1 RimJ/RimL family protein N-acetyltransferase [Rhodoblastus acidophilus]MCW2334479.1 RimJ/RimL family protein N-acetyltransferase [Rhodoblastus acidophilus]